MSSWSRAVLKGKLNGDEFTDIPLKGIFENENPCGDAFTGLLTFYF